jgi:hypothetical protein
MEPAQWAMGVRDAEWVPVQKVDSSVVAADSAVDFVDAGRETLPTVRIISIPEKIWKRKSKNWKLN